MKSNKILVTLLIVIATIGLISVVVSFVSSTPKGGTVLKDAPITQSEMNRNTNITKR